MIPVAFPHAADGIAREEALLAAGRPALLLWRAEAPALVVPAAWARRSGFGDAQRLCARAGWPLVARSSGGGAVPQGPGTVNLAVVVPVRAGFVIEEGYRLICGAISEALTRFEIRTGTGAVQGALCDGRWNVTAGGRKLAGTAQRWRSGAGGKAALIHAALLIDRPHDDFWPALADAHRVTGQATHFRPDAHVALPDILPGAMRVGPVFGALARAVEDRLTAFTPDLQQAV